MPQNNDLFVTYLVRTIGGILTGGVLWIWNRIGCSEKAVVNIRESLSRHKLYIAENYTPKDEFKEFKKEIITRFDRLEDLIRKSYK